MLHSLVIEHVINSGSGLLRKMGFFTQGSSENICHHLRTFL